MSSRCPSTNTDRPRPRRDAWSRRTGPRGGRPPAESRGAWGAAWQTRVMASSTSSLPRHERMPTWGTRAWAGPGGRPPRGAWAGPGAGVGARGVGGRGVERAADGPAVDAGMEASEIGARVDHLDLARRHAGRHQPALDRLADRHAGGRARRGVAP